MIRKIIKIDKEKCNGCGNCATACHESAIAIVNGKAELIREDYCDGLGDCLPVCPTGAISFESHQVSPHNRTTTKKAKNSSQLSQWPVQIKLVSVNAPYFDGANLLVAADCTAFAYGNFHNEFIRNHITLIGCPKLDSIDYSEKLNQIISANNIKSLTIVRMEVPCCGGIENAAKKALATSGKFIQWRVITISTDGKIIE